LDETPARARGDLGLFVLLAVPGDAAAYALTGKFGCPPAEAVALLRAARLHARTLGVAFHVGSQCEDPAAWTRALALVGEVVREAGVPVEVVDVGGGFPVRYPDRDPRGRGGARPQPRAAVVGRARPRAGRRRHLGGDPGPAGPRQGALRQRR